MSSKQLNIVDMMNNISLSKKEENQLKKLEDNYYSIFDTFNKKMTGNGTEAIIVPDLFIHIVDSIMKMNNNDHISKYIYEYGSNGGDIYSDIEEIYSKMISIKLNCIKSIISFGSTNKTIMKCIISIVNHDFIVNKLIPQLSWQSDDNNIFTPYFQHIKDGHSLFYNAKNEVPFITSFIVSENVTCNELTRKIIHPMYISRLLFAKVNRITGNTVVNDKLVKLCKGYYYRLTKDSSYFKTMTLDKKIKMLRIVVKIEESIKNNFNDIDNHLALLFKGLLDDDKKKNIDDDNTYFNQLKGVATFGFISWIAYNSINMLK